MKLEQLYEMQKVLDARIIKEKGLEGQDLLPNTVLALQVEIGELANEWRGFKHWSNDREPRTKVPATAWGAPYRNLLLEEYVDGIHFFLSIARQLDVIDMPEFIPRVIEENLTEQFTELFVMVSYIHFSESDMTIHERWEMAFMSYMDLGYALGFTCEQIAAAYVEKNKTNHDRQANGY